MTLLARSVGLGERVRQVSATFEPGTITAICGPNGAGKSSLLELLAGLTAPERGSIEIDGASLSLLKPRMRAQRIGYLPQDQGIAWDVAARAVAELGRLPHRDTNAEPVEAAMAALDVAHLATRRAQTLSGGEKARVLLARVLAGEPEWVLADEPLAALDLGHQHAMMRHLRALADGGIGVVVVLHDLAHAMNRADRVLVLDAGRGIVHGPPLEALSARIIAQVWGIEAEWIGRRGEQALITRSPVEA